MKCEIPGCAAEARKNVHVKGIFHGIYLDKMMHVCEAHKQSKIQAAAYTEHAPLVNPYLEVPRLLKTGT